MAEIYLSWSPIYDQNTRKTIPFGAARTYIAHIREYPPPAGLWDWIDIACKCPFIVLNTEREIFLIWINSCDISF